MREAAAILAGLCFALSLVCLAQQLGLALVGIVGRSRLRKIVRTESRTRFVVLVPAHNEATGVLPTLISLKTMTYPRQLFSIVVIADNCTDETAAIALGAGVDVLVRHNPALRGKGQALAWAFQQLEQSHYDAAVVIDADTRADAGLLARFNDAIAADAGRAGAAQAGPAAYQARYEFAATNATEPWLQMLSVASKAAENSFVYRAREVLGWVNLLQGNGFCLPAAVLAKVPWTAGSIVEDAEYAIDLCLAGMDCRYLDDVRVVSRIAASGIDSAPQKVRWSKGMMLLMRRRVPGLLAEAVRRRSPRLAEAALMLLMTSRLTTIYFLLAGLPLALFAPARDRLVLVLMIMMILLDQALYALLVLCASSEGERSLKNIWLLPRYVAHLATAHLRSAASLRSREWTRTVR